MNSTIRKAGERAILPPRRNPITRADTSAENEVKRLAAIIEQNHAALDRGWAELNRLNQQIAALETSKVNDHRRQPASHATAAESLLNAA
jgi:hypothetical protein